MRIDLLLGRCCSLALTEVEEDLLPKRDLCRPKFVKIVPDLQPPILRTLQHFPTEPTSKREKIVPVPEHKYWRSQQPDGPKRDSRLHEWPPESANRGKTFRVRVLPARRRQTSAAAPAVTRPLGSVADQGAQRRGCSCDRRVVEQAQHGTRPGRPQQAPTTLQTLGRRPASPVM